jgi:flavodoxin
MALSQEEIADLREMATGDNKTIAEVAKKQLEAEGVPIKEKAAPKTKAAPKAKVEKKTKAKRKVRVKEEKPRKKVLEATKDKITYKGKEYTLADCQDLFNAFKTKIKKEKKSSKESSARSTAEKIIDKAQTTIKQIMSDKGARKKMKENPTVAKRELKSVETKFRSFIEAIEKFLGKKMSKTQVDSIFSVIHKKELAHGGHVMGQEFGRGGGVRRSKAAIAQDKRIKAKHPGYRTSDATGDEYYEDRPNRSDINRTARFGKGGGVKRTKAGIAQDRQIKALHPGKRVSAEGETYYEARPNRSDINRTKRV